MHNVSISFVVSQLLGFMFVGSVNIFKEDNTSLINHPGISPLNKDESLCKQGITQDVSYGSRPCISGLCLFMNSHSCSSITGIC